MQQQPALRSPSSLRTTSSLSSTGQRSRKLQRILISNAIKYGSGEPIDVTLRPNDGYLCLQVRDRGLGISVKDQARIFERFERLVTGRPTVGFGLGLWVVGQLTESMGGTIAVESDPGNGSTFTVRLPLQKIKGNE